MKRKSIQKCVKKKKKKCSDAALKQHNLHKK